MAEYLKVPVSLSLSGSLVILILLLCGPLLRGRVSRRWQYYVWLVAIFRLLLPLSPQASPIGALFREPEAPPAVQAASPYAAETVPAQAETAPKPLRPVQPSVPPPDQASDGISPAEALALAWLGGALVLIVWRVSAYLHFLRCLRAGRREVSDPALLDLLARTGEELKVRRPVELWENPLAASPMLLGLFRPRIVLPSAAVSETDFRCTALHELTHYRRRDLPYKWLVQLTVCLHWWNPLVWVMAREIDRACELACDEAVLRRLKPEERLSYGDALLRALESGGGYRAAQGSVSLGESAELLKERLSAIMNFKKPSRWTALLSLVLAAALTTGAAAAGAYTGPAKRDATPPLSVQAASNENLRLRAVLLAKQSYEEGDAAAFNIAVPFLSEEARGEWLERCYEDGNLAFFNCLLSQTQEEETINAILERAYEDGNSAFFSVLVNHMDWDADTLDAWIARTSQGNAAFLSILLKAADRDEELEALEEAFEARQTAEYEAAGITREDGAYYYQGKPVRIFLDLRFDASCVTLEMNPQGVLDIKVERDAGGKIQSVRNLDAVEAAELFGDLNSPEEDLGNLEGGVTQALNKGSPPDLAANLDARAMEVEDLPAAAREAMGQCAVRTWYVIHSEGRQYLYCNGFPWRYAWSPAWEDGSWLVKVRKLKKLDSGYVLLSFPDNSPLCVTLEGELVPLTDIQT